MARPRAVLLDALGTLLRLCDPVPVLRRELAARGIEAGEGQAAEAMRREIAYYRAHLMEGRDASGLADLRRRCAAEAATALGDRSEPAEVEAALLAALRFEAFPEVPGALRRLRDAGLGLVVVSNWDASLAGVLADTGLDALVDGAVASAVVGRAKPDPEPLRRGLALAGVAPHEAVHVGDSPREDVAGARAAGMAAILVRRDEAGGGPYVAAADVTVVASLAAAAEVVLGAYPSA